MEKVLVNIPSGYKFLSEVKDEAGRTFRLPNGILNKELTGCGGTTLALEDENKTVICSPRIRLLENKAEQYPNSLLVVQGVTEEQIKQYINTVAVPKILTTYDSFRKIIKVVGDFSNWKIVVDEFQCLLSDSAFKADTELKFLNLLQNCPYVTYMSATPILDKFISQIDYFKDKTYYQLNWADKEKVFIRRIKTANPIGGAIAIIVKFKNGFFPTVDDEAGNKVESKEAVIFLNSVTDIVNIIKHTNLQPEEVNIIVADNTENQKLIKKLGNGYSTGNIPLKGQEHKKFTFCTSTAYMGVDFYSETASTFVISNCKKVNTAVDIATELCQIAGRQRLDSNPFRKYIFFIYNTTKEEVSEEEIQQLVDSKKRRSYKKIQDFQNETPEERKLTLKEMKAIYNTIGNETYYLSYDEDSDSLEYNQLAELSDKLSFEVQHHTYKNGLMVRKELAATSKFDITENQSYEAFGEYLRGNIQRSSFSETMKAYITYKEHPNKFVRALCNWLEIEQPKLKDYYSLLGADRIRALSYKEANLKREVVAISKEGNIAYHLKQLLYNGIRISKVNLKKMIQQQYDRLGIKQTAKATEITKYGFDCREVKIKEGNKYINGFELYEIQQF